MVIWHFIAASLLPPQYVALEILSVSQISLTGRVRSDAKILPISICFRVRPLGLPPLLPRARADANSATARSQRLSLSNWAIVVASKSFPLRRPSRMPISDQYKGQLTYGTRTDYAPFYFRGDNPICYISASPIGDTFLTLTALSQ